MNTIKKLRSEMGFTQVQLATKTGLSLRTIQRVEASDAEPKGHTLKVLCEVLKINPISLRAPSVKSLPNQESDRMSVKFINLSVLSIFIFPFGNLIMPLIVWRKNRSSKIVDEIGRKIINVQILWTLVFVFLLIVAPFININHFTSIPLILYVLFFALAINIVIVIRTALSLQENKNDILNIPFQLI